MAKMIDAFHLKLCLKQIESLQAKRTFNENLLALQLAKIEAVKSKTESEITQTANLKLRAKAIEAGVETDFIKNEHERKLKQIDSSFQLKHRAVRESCKRKVAKIPEKKAVLSDCRNQADKSIEAKKQKAIAALAKKHEPDDKHLEQRQSEYQVLKTKIDAETIHKQDIAAAKATRLTNSISTRMMKKLERINQILAIREASVAKLKESLPQLSHGTPEDVILRVENLTMRFGGLVAVDDLSFDVKQGEIFGLIGPNGAGKTTVFNCITKFYRPASGRMYFRKHPAEVISLNDYPVHKIIRQGIVRTFQNVELVWELPVIDNLLVAAHTLYRTGFFGQLIHTRKLKHEEAVLRKKATDVLAMLGLLPYMYMIPFGLPYGILKKIELARTLMVDPRMIILDEPAAGLNDAETKDLARIIRSIRDTNQATIFLVEHDMGLVMDVCDTICAISFGKKLATGTPREIQANKLVRDAYLGEE